MVVPTNTAVEIDLTSSDVIHEFWVPYLRFKQEALPNWSNSFRMTLSSTGRWIGRCSEFCGLLHSDMDFYLQAITPAQYRHWASVHHGAVLT
jgi:cytochrome c oxidase subunit 2